MPETGLLIILNIFPSIHATGAVVNTDLKDRGRSQGSAGQQSVISNQLSAS